MAIGSVLGAPMGGASARLNSSEASALSNHEQGLTELLQRARSNTERLRGLVARATGAEYADEKEGPRPVAMGVVGRLQQHHSDLQSATAEQYELLGKLESII